MPLGKTLNGKRQIIKFPEPKLVYFIPVSDYGKDQRCDLTSNKEIAWKQGTYFVSKKAEKKDPQVQIPQLVKLSDIFTVVEVFAIIPN